MQEDPAVCLYFIANGIVEIFDADFTHLTTLNQGSHFGEMSLMKVACRMHGG